MTEAEKHRDDAAPERAPPPPAALRALAEAEERRRAACEPASPARELGGRGGLDPARYGDWESRGIASDF
ncbi:hypothetical+protein [Methylocapsa aurea]|uniref:DUF1674 domain-containing protein n=1 Tax=Methylocapsa aurea TaxID=663610 RepID=UPI003D18C694